jgi:Big-like domain-containing protein
LTANTAANPALYRTADANAVVTLTEGLTVLGSATANASGAWSFTPTGLAQGAQTITATETDLAGNIGSTAVNFVLDFDSHTGLSGVGTNENLVFNEGFGNVTISNSQTDTIAFGSGLFSSFTDLLHHSSQDKAGDTIIADNHGDVLTLTHTAMTALQASHFLLG